MKPRVSDEELRQGISVEDDLISCGCVECRSMLDLRDLRAAAREAVPIIHDYLLMRGVICSNEIHDAIGEVACPDCKARKKKLSRLAELAGEGE